VWFADEGRLTARIHETASSSRMHFVWTGGLFAGAPICSLAVERMPDEGALAFRQSGDNWLTEA
jgi:hypothetical protein